jgi:hypothetical protein
VAGAFTAQGQLHERPARLGVADAHGDEALQGLPRDRPLDDARKHRRRRRESENALEADPPEALPARAPALVRRHDELHELPGDLAQDRAHVSADLAPPPAVDGDRERAPEHAAHLVPAFPPPAAQDGAANAPHHGLLDADAPLLHAAHDPERDGAEVDAALTLHEGPSFPALHELQDGSQDAADVAHVAHDLDAPAHAEAHEHAPSLGDVGRGAQALRVPVPPAREGRERSE